jgi:hypothetical protein
MRAMAAATAVEDTLAFDGLVAGTAERWLRGAIGEDWVKAARTALARLRLPPER